jgi:hypothetical protein
VLSQLLDLCAEGGLCMPNLAGSFLKSTGKFCMAAGTSIDCFQTDNYRSDFFSQLLDFKAFINVKVWQEAGVKGKGLS